MESLKTSVVDSIYSVILYLLIRASLCKDAPFCVADLAVAVGVLSAIFFIGFVEDRKNLDFIRKES